MNTHRAIRTHPLARIAAAGVFLTALPLACPAQSAELATRTGNEIGVTVSSYKYTEPSNMSIKATKIGIEYSGTWARNSEWFALARLRYANGNGDYSSVGTGTMSDRPDWYYEIKGAVGRDFLFGDYSLSPYVGLGYRYLFNDLRGLSSTGNQGYRRESNYFTLPIGVMHRMNLSDQAQLLTTLEYDQLIRGRQESKLSDISPPGPDASNTQRRGYGLQLSAMYQTSRWSVGPYLLVWRLGESERNAVTEPKNDTSEFGVRSAFRF